MKREYQEFFIAKVGSDERPAGPKDIENLQDFMET